MKQSLQLRFSQHLALTPQLQQSIRLLQLSSQELNQELETILQENPLLERIDAHDGNAPLSDMGSSNSETASEPAAATATETSASEQSHQDTFDGDDFTDFGTSLRWDESSQNGDDDGDFTPQESANESLRDYLVQQIHLLQLSERDRSLAGLLIDSINDDGYLDQSLEEIAAMLPPELEIDPLELQTTLKLIQSLDPAGVGARNLSECLSLQLRALPQDTPYLSQAKQVVEEYLPALASRDFAKLKKVLRCEDAALRQVQHLITQLNPKPGAEFAHLASDHFIQHEIVVKKTKGIWLASLNEEAIPKLRINQVYANILKRNRDSSNQYLTSQMQEAKWMIKNIQQRFSTILRVSQAIVDRQRNFFEHGEVAMRPLVLREIADTLELHESTVSRVTTRKYMLTPRGVFELKYFFGSHVATEAGGACSATAIRALIKQMIAEENPKRPLSDSQITEILGKQGIVVARRTIAKYRESLNISAANLRKSL